MTLLKPVQLYSKMRQIHCIISHTETVSMKKAAETINISNKI